MAKVVRIGSPQNDAERLVIGALRDGLPDDYTLYHNLELGHHGQLFEVDLAIIAPHAVFLVDVKGFHGRICVRDGWWSTDLRPAYRSPLPKLRQHARELAGLLRAPDRRRRLSVPYVDAVIVLSADGVVLDDPDEQEKGHVVHLSDAAAFFQARQRIPANFPPVTAPALLQLNQAFRRAARPLPSPRHYGNWTVHQFLGERARYREYRAFNTLAGKDAGSVLLRVYDMDQYAPLPERQRSLSDIAKAYHALAAVPSHANLVNEHDFFSLEDEHGYVLVLDDPHGRGLADVLAAGLVPRGDAVVILRDLLVALAHTHGHGVVHGDLRPDAVVLGPHGEALLTNFDRAIRGGAPQPSQSPQEPGESATGTSRRSARHILMRR